MKFINYLESIAGVDIYPLISLLMFFLFFIGLFTWVVKADKGFMERMSELPIENEDRL